MRRRPGLSVRLKLTLSYAGFVVLAGVVLLAVVWEFLLRYIPGGGVGRLWIAPNRYVLLQVFGPAAAAAMLFLLVFGLAGGWILAGRMLAPLTQITAAIRTTGNRSLSHRIRLTGRQDEFRDLSDAFDSMLRQLEYHVAEQQRFAANASHELRTPLAITRALLDVARKDPHHDRDELIERLHAANTRAIDLIEALLMLSRGDRANFTRENVDLCLIAEEAAETLLPLAERRRITLEVTGSAAQTSGSAGLLLRVVTNLVQNAIVHNLPAGGTVTVHTGTRDDTSELRVQNTGGRLPPELVATLTQPFQRGTERVRTGEHAGVGLGLAIVQSIVRAHGGTLDLVGPATGGLAVTVRLPAAPDPGVPPR